MRQCLRHITVRKCIRHNGLYEARGSLLALAEAKNIRTLEVSHAQICSGPLSIDDLVAMCGPLLNFLKASWAAQTLAFSARDVHKITLPTSAALKEMKDPKTKP